MKTHVVRRLAGSCLLAALGGGLMTVDTVATPASRHAPHLGQVQQQMPDLAIPFEANTGQQDPRVAFTARTFAGTLFVTRGGRLVYSLPGRTLAAQGERAASHKRGPGWVLSESLVGARPVVRAGRRSVTHISRFIGSNPANWQPSVPAFDRVALGNPWPGIAVELAARAHNVEKLFTVAPGADARRIVIRLGGAKHVTLASDGALVAQTGNGSVTFSAPRAWQDIKGQHRPVRASYMLAGDRYGFRLSAYDPSYAVVIDPLVQSTYLGGNGDDFINALALDANGDVFVAGLASSANFPGTIGGAQPATGGGGGDAFVAKLNGNLTVLVQATYLGGSGYDQAGALVLDSSGQVYVAGSTTSTDFPGTANGEQPGNGGSADAFIAKLNNGLTAISQSTYLGGSGLDGATAITLDASGHVLVAGSTTGAFPGTTGGAQPVFGGSAFVGDTFGDAFVAKLDTGLTTLAQATYLGGSGDDYPNGIALDANGVFVVGNTGSLNFPQTAGAPQSVYGGGVTSMADAFVTRMNTGLTAFDQSTYLGGNREERADAIVLDASGNVFVAGTTSSLVLLGTAGGAQPAKAAGYDSFVAEFGNALTTLTQSTYLGGNGDDAAHAIALDSSANVFITGSTASTDFPGTSGGAQGTYGGGVGSGFGGDVFVARLTSGLTSLYQATYLGGTDNERANGIAVYPPNQTVYVAGMTISSDFPGTAGGAQPAIAGTADNGFVAELTHGLHDVASSTANNDGDPHLTTVDGVHYNFQGAGEYVALRGDGGLEIQTRQTAVQSAATFLGTDSYDGISSCVSLNSAVAARAGTHRVTLEPSFEAFENPSGMELRVDGVVASLDSRGLNLGGGNRVVPAPIGVGIEIDFADGTVLVVTPRWWSYMSLWYLDVDVLHVDAATGLLGPIAPGSWLPALPDGSSVGPMPDTLAQRYAVLYGTFGNAWRVSDASTLFDYKLGQSTRTFTRLNWPLTSAPCRTPPSPVAPAKPLDLATAQQVCQPITDANANADCISDVMLTGERGFAKSYLVSQQLKAGATATVVNHTLDLLAQKRSWIYLATVTSIGSPPGRTPKGTVQFLFDGQVVRAQVKLDRNGRAKWETSEFKILDHDIVASYLPAKGSVFLPSSGLDAGNHGAPRHSIRGATR
jgi:hypothetical protein